jgi:DNA polymerase-3 subunit epsilon
MKLALVYDTETSGLPLFSEPSEDPRQPHIVQLAALLVDLDSRRTVASLDMIVRPEGWTIPDDVAAIHGITTEHASDVGASASIVIGAFMELWEAAAYRVAHNESFDARMVRIALIRHDSAEIADVWKAGPAECTARLATPLCKLPPTERMRATGRTHFKTPNLGEAVRHFLQREHEGAHTAMADVLGCRDVYFAIKAGAVTA